MRCDGWRDRLGSHLEATLGKQITGFCFLSCRKGGAALSRTSSLQKGQAGGYVDETQAPLRLCSACWWTRLPGGSYAISLGSHGVPVLGGLPADFPVQRTLASGTLELRGGTGAVTVSPLALGTQMFDLQGTVTMLQTHRCEQKRSEWQVGVRQLGVLTQNQ